MVALWSGPNLVCIYPTASTTSRSTSSSSLQLAVLNSPLTSSSILRCDRRQLIRSAELPNGQVSSAGNLPSLRETKVDDFVGHLDVDPDERHRFRFSGISTGYVNFPGFELSTTMSVYLVSVQVVESASLP